MRTYGDRCRDNRHDDRPVYTLQAIVAATIACRVYTPRQSPRVYTTGDRRRNDRSDSRGDDCSVCVYALLVYSRVPIRLACRTVGTVQTVGNYE